MAEDISVNPAGGDTAENTAPPGGLHNRLDKRKTGIVYRATEGRPYRAAAPEPLEAQACMI